MIASSVRRPRILRTGELFPSSRAHGTRATIWSSPAGSAPAGGDWCDAFALSEHTVAVTVGDVSGHGAAVAQTMTAMRAAVVQAMREIRVPSDVLSVANEVASRQGDGVLVTAIVGILDDRLGTLTFANAGHPPPLMMTGDDHAFLMQSPADIPLGVFTHHRAADFVFAVPPDALVVFYTDGITEHDHDPVRGEIELVAAARLVHGRPELNAARAIARNVFKTGRGDDDAAAMCLRSLPARA